MRMSGDEYRNVFKDCVSMCVRMYVCMDVVRVSDCSCMSRYYLYALESKAYIFIHGMNSIRIINTIVKKTNDFRFLWIGFSTLFSFLFQKKNMY